jgi:hypothetical protein
MIDPPRRIAAAVTGAGIVLCILGWYQIAGQPTVPQQLPYLASATVPGAALLCAGLLLLLRAPAGDGVVRRADRVSDAARAGAGGLWRVPDGRYLHTADCPLLDGRTDLTAAVEGRDAGLRPCPLCQAGADPTSNAGLDPDSGSAPGPHSNLSPNVDSDLDSDLDADLRSGPDSGPDSPPDPER